MSGRGMPLAMVSPGKLVTVAGVRAGWGLQRRLADMGLTPGVQIRVLNSQMPGPVLIDLRGSRVALGHGVAQKILVKEGRT
jgi:ferrous iron transport protein A